MTLMDITTPSTADWVEHAATIGAEFRTDAAASDVAGEISHSAFARLRDEGFTTALVPTEFGGGGASHADMGAILRTLARFDPAVAVTLSMHSHLVAFQVWRHN